MEKVKVKLLHDDGTNKVINYYDGSVEYNNESFIIKFIDNDKYDNSIKYSSINNEIMIYRTNSINKSIYKYIEGSVINGTYMFENNNINIPINCIKLNVCMNNIYIVYNIVGDDTIHHLNVNIEYHLK